MPKDAASARTPDTRHTACDIPALADAIPIVLDANLRKVVRALVRTKGNGDERIKNMMELVGGTPRNTRFQLAGALKKLGLGDFPLEGIEDNPACAVMAEAYAICEDKQRANGRPKDPQRAAEELGERMFALDEASIRTLHAYAHARTDEDTARALTMTIDRVRTVLAIVMEKLGEPNFRMPSTFEEREDFANRITRAFQVFVHSGGSLLGTVNVVPPRREDPVNRQRRTTALNGAILGHPVEIEAPARRETPPPSPEVKGLQAPGSESSIRISDATTTETRPRSSPSPSSAKEPAMTPKRKPNKKKTFVLDPADPRIPQLADIIARMGPTQREAALLLPLHDNLEELGGILGISYAGVVQRLKPIYREAGIERGKAGFQERRALMAAAVALYQERQDTSPAPQEPAPAAAEPVQDLQAEPPVGTEPGPADAEAAAPAEDFEPPPEAETPAYPAASPAVATAPAAPVMPVIFSEFVPSYPVRGVRALSSAEDGFDSQVEELLEAGYVIAKTTYAVLPGTPCPVTTVFLVKP